LATDLAAARMTLDQTLTLSPPFVKFEVDRQPCRMDGDILDTTPNLQLYV